MIKKGSSYQCTLLALRNTFIISFYMLLSSCGNAGFDIKNIRYQQSINNQNVDLVKYDEVSNNIKDIENKDKIISEEKSNLKNMPVVDKGKKYPSRMYDFLDTIEKHESLLNSNIEINKSKKKKLNNLSHIQIDKIFQEEGTYKPKYNTYNSGGIPIVSGLIGFLFKILLILILSALFAIIILGFLLIFEVVTF